ncbi:MAG: YqaJ viral recombinase family protein [Candidatus Thiodiazotropha taylori]|uniref:YqaJ viral recombinase family protein n=1 Tax=Candidatus Thiodiazotropha taylori TaxID=2792791 RepID=A0A9E4K9Y0_9GAMM|nr:YqaJ viral recombinase family protein [Candidatus Thiodiazotropha taylori]MCW4255943.1 YqaJ viral recombinase family protein [Candidatus Thiodiazotropha taylori]
MEQLSEEWFAARCGKVTASKICDVVAKTRSGWAASRINYMAQLLVERLTGMKEEGYTNAAMQWGVDTEPQARDAYMFMTDNDVVQVGFINHPIIEMSGASPDGLIADDGLVEIKCPNTATHINTFRTGKIDKKYMDQMYWQMACTEREWCDFVSFDPRLPEEYQLFVKRVEIDSGRVKELEEGVIQFNQELLVMIEELKQAAA